MTNARTGLALLAAGLLSLAVACGGGADDEAEPSPTASPPSEPTTTEATPSPEPEPEPTTDPDSSEFDAMITDVEERFEDMTGDSLQLDCPDGEVPAPGESIDCTGRVTEQEFEYDFTITGTDDGVDYEYSLRY